MTIKEIAGLCGCNETTVQRWIHSDVLLNCNMQLRSNIISKLEKGSPEKPSDYDLEETLAIIGDGGENKVLAALLAENAANKNAVVLAGSRQPQFDEEKLMEMITRAVKTANEQLIFEKLMQMEKSIANIEISLTRLYLPSVEQNDEASVKQFIKDYIVIESALQYETKSDVWEKYKEFYGKKIKMHDFVELFLSLLPSCEMSITNLGAGRKQLCFFGISMKKAKNGG